MPFSSFLLLCGLLAPRPQDPEPVFRPVSFERALEEAAAADRMLVASFAIEDSEECRKLKEKTWTNAALVRWLEVAAVAVEVDGGERSDLVDRFRVRSYPTVILLDGDGIEYDRFVGFVRPGQFVKGLVGIRDARERLIAARLGVASTPDDPLAHMELARALAVATRRDAAVDVYDHVWRRYRSNPEYRRLRVYRVVAEVTGLGAQLEIVNRTLNKWKRHSVSILEDPEGDNRVLAAEEVSSITRHQADADAMVRIYRKVAELEDVPVEVLDALCDQQVVSWLYNRGLFEELVAALRDPLVRIETTFASVDEARARERNGIVNPDEAALPLLVNGLYSRGGMYVETLLQVGDDDAALELIDFLLIREPYAACYAPMIRAARKAGRVELAREIQQRGRDSLDPKQRAELDEAFPPRPRKE